MSLLTALEIITVLDDLSFQDGGKSNAYRFQPWEKGIVRVS
ncbi:MAG: hypothetical protein O2890_08195 [Cyanobacteria bacterium]|nr:hypothetical protein [Cyanobacteriota bacterium]